MAHVPKSLLVHTVSIRERTGTTGNGAPIYGAAFEVRAFVAEKNGRTVAPDGEVVASTGQFVCRLDDGRRIGMLAQATLPSGRKTKVVNVALGDDGGRGAWQSALVSVQ